MDGREPGAPSDSRRFFAVNVQKQKGRGWLHALWLIRINRRYWVTVLQASPTLKPAPETAVPTAETSSTSVSRITPTGDDMRRITCPVDGSLISLVTRSTVSWSPTFRPALPPTFSTICPPSTAATKPSTCTVRATSLPLSAISSPLICLTAALTASPRMVFWKSLLPKSTAPPPHPCQLPPPASNDVLSRLDSPLPDATPMISAVSMFTRRASTATIALDFLCPKPPTPYGPQLPPPPPTFVFWVSLPNCVTLPTMMASTPSSFPIFAAEVASARLLLEKFCSVRILSIALRSMTE